MCPHCSGKTEFDYAKIKKEIVSFLKEVPRRDGFTQSMFERYLGGQNGPKVPADVLKNCLDELWKEDSIQRVPLRRPDPGRSSPGSFNALGTQGQEYSFYAWRLKTT